MLYSAVGSGRKSICAPATSLPPSRMPTRAADHPNAHLRSAHAGVCRIWPSGWAATNSSHSTAEMDTVTRALYQSEPGFLHVPQIEALDYNLDDLSLRRTLMTSPYTPRPALKTAAVSLVPPPVQKPFPAFLRCSALHFASENDFAHAELAASPAEFRNAVARLSPNPILGPLSAGVPVVL